MVAERVDGAAGVVEADGDRLGGLLDREVTGDVVRRVVDTLHAGAGEGDLRILLHVEEVVAAQVRVAVAVARVDAVGLDRHLQVGVLRVLGVERPAALELVERTADLGDHRVAGDEADAAVRRIDRVVAGEI